MGLNEFVLNFRSALQQEIDHLRQTNRVRIINLKKGILQKPTLSDEFIYVFETEDEILIPEDSPIELRYKREIIGGILKRVDGNKLFVSLRQNFGDVIRDVKLINNPAAFLQRLDNKYEKIQEEEISINSKLAISVFNEAKSYDSISDIDLIDSDVIRLNDDQKIAVSKALKARKYFIWGPPGTGKTQAISAMLYSLLSNDKRVIITSNTHKAVDGAMSKLFEILENDAFLKSLLENQMIVRYGGISRVKQGELAKYRITIDELAKEKSKDLNLKLAQIRDNLIKENKSLTGVIEIKKNKKIYEESSRKIDEIKELLDDSKKLIPKIKKEVSRLRRKLEEASNRAIDFERQKEKLIQEKSILYAQKRLIEEVKQIQEAISKIKSQIKENKINFDENEELRKTQLKVIRDLQKTIEETQNSNTLINWIKGRNITTLVNQLNSQQNKLENYKNESTKIRERVDSLRLKLKEKQKILSEKTMQSKIIFNSVDEVLKKIDKVELKLSKLDESIMALNIDNLIEGFESKRRDYGKLLKEKNENEQNLKDIKIRLVTIKKNKKLLNKINTISWEELKNKERKIKEKIDKLISKENQILESLAQIESEILNNAKLIGCTLTKAMMSQLFLEKPADVIIIDEVSMANLPLLFYCLGLSKKQAILVGDPYQLPPIVSCEKKLVLEFLKKSIFEYTDVVNSTDMPTVGFLRQQYRMDKPIMDLINRHFYKKEFRLEINPITQEERESELRNLDLFLGYNVILVDTSNINPWSSRERNLENGSRINFYNALLVKKLIEDFKSKVGVITPYAGQARLINRTLKGLSGLNYISATVHKFQGDERQVIIFDTCDSNPYFPSRLLRKNPVREGVFPDSPKLLNVALSRAQLKLIIVANSKYFFHRFERYPNEELTSIFRYIKHKSGQKKTKFKVIPAENILGYDAKEIGALRKAVYGRTQPLIPQRKDYKLLNELEFYPFLDKDISNVIREVVIFSPFVTTSRVLQLTPILKKIKRKNISAVLYTKHIDEQINPKDSLRALKILTDHGFEIRIRKRMHEKIVLIDGVILYFGSLNPFSQCYSKELMIRLVDKKIIRSIHNFEQDLFFGVFDYESSISDKESISEEEATKLLKNLRKLIAFEKRLFLGALMHNISIEEIVKKKPKTLHELSKIDEFKNIKRHPVHGFEDAIFDIARRIKS